MSDFNPGDGWRRASHEEWVEADVSLALNERGGGATYWVREAPVPSLPSEPYTVIRVTWVDNDAEVFTLHGNGEWRDEFGSSLVTANPRITGFEVLAEPRAGAVKRAEESARRLTAKAVLDRVRRHHRRGSLNDTRLAAIAREFGVSS